MMMMLAHLAPHRRSFALTRCGEARDSTTANTVIVDPHSFVVIIIIPRRRRTPNFGHLTTLTMIMRR
jgi:hypothetical protein